MRPTPSQDVAILLPPKENFASDRMGAISLVVRDLARAGLPEWRATVLGLPAGGSVPADIPFLPVARRIPWPLDRTARFAAAAGAVLRRSPGFALVEVHNRPAVALALARTLAHVPIALMLHNDPQGMDGSGSVAARRALLGRLARVGCVSDFLRGRLLEGIDPADPLALRAATLHNGIEAGPPPLPQQARERVIRFAGRVCADKGADSFVEACAIALPQLAGWRAELIGADRFAPDSPDTPFVTALRPRAAAAGVVLRGFLPNDMTLDLLGQAAIVVVPSRWADPFPRVAQEAMARGTALIASDRGGLPESVGDAGLLADPDDPGSLAQAMLALARDDSLRARLAAAGRMRVEGRFSMRASAARWASFRTAALSARPAAAA